MISVDPHWGAVTVAAWLLSYALHSTLLLGCVALLGRSKKIPVGLEQTLWKTALLGSLVTATVVTLGWNAGAIGARFYVSPREPVTGLLPSRALLPGSAPGHAAELPTLRTWMVLAAWALTGMWGLLRLMSARRYLQVQLCERRDLTSGPEWEALERLRQRAGIRRSIRLTVSANLGSPIAIGDDEICLPERALTDLSAAEMQSALAHELAHLARRDPGWKGLTAGLDAVFFFQPLLRAARRRLDETAEYLADDWAVRHSGGEVSLARCLAAVAAWQSPRLQTVAASSMADGASPLLRRVERLLGGRPSEPRRVWRYTGALLLLVGAWIVAPGVTAESPRSRSAMPRAALLGEPGPWQAEIVDVPAPPARIEMKTPVMSGAPPMRRMRLRHPGAVMTRRAAPAETAPPPESAARPPMLDRDTAPVARVIVIPHEAIHARIEVLHALSQTENLDPEIVRALLLAEHQLMQFEMAQRGVQILWMVEPPAPPEPPVPPAPPESQI